MRKLLLCLLLLMPLASCGNSSAAPANPRPVSCKVPVLHPLPTVSVWECPDHENVCMTVHAAVEIGKYLAEVQEVETALAGCPWVERVPE